MKRVLILTVFLSIFFVSLLLVLSGCGDGNEKKVIKRIIITIPKEEGGPVFVEPEQEKGYCRWAVSYDDDGNEIEISDEFCGTIN